MGVDDPAGRSGHDAADATDAGDSAVGDTDADDTDPDTDANAGDTDAGTATDDRPVDVSVVIPALNEADYLRGALASLASLDTAYDYEVVVVDGGSTDGTPEIAREYDATVLDRPGTGIAAARNEGAAWSDGEWLAFVDADTEVRANYLTAMLGFLEAEGLAAASSYCRLTGPLRARVMEVTINHVFSRLERPILPGFNTVVHRSAFEAVGGFPEVPNEDTAFSRLLGRESPTGYCREVLVETSGRRIADRGLTGTLYHYLVLDRERLRSEY